MIKCPIIPALLAIVSDVIMLWLSCDKIRENKIWNVSSLPYMYAYIVPGNTKHANNSHAETVMYLSCVYTVRSLLIVFHICHQLLYLNNAVSLSDIILRYPCEKMNPTSKWFPTSTVHCCMSLMCKLRPVIQYVYKVFFRGGRKLLISKRQCVSMWLLILWPHKKLGHPLLWRHNGRDSVSNHQPHDCLLNRLLRRRSKQTSKLCVTGLCAGNSPGTGEFLAQRASNAENVSIWWRHHDHQIWHWPYLYCTFF